jgi:TolB-like protein
VVRKGYLAHFPLSPATESPATQPQRRRKFLLLAVLASLVAIVLYTIASRVSDSTVEVREVAGGGPPMVAVLPFISDSQIGDSEFFATGVHNDLLTQLAKLQSIRVISATSVMEYRNVGRNIRKIGEELGADVILEGSIQIVPNQIRINTQLIDTRTDEHLWAESYDRELSPVNIFDVQSEIARAISKELNTTLTAEDSE